VAAARVEAWEQELVGLEAEITRQRARQVQLLRKLDRYQVDAGAGMRTMGDWVSAHLDVSSQTANRLWQLARAADDEIDALMAQGRCGVDRAAVLVKLHAAEVSDDQLGDATATRFSLGRLYGLLDRVRSFTVDEERSAFENRYLVLQPSLDDAAYKLWGLLPGADGQIVAAALHRRETELPVLPGEGSGQGQRRADALTAICLDTLAGETGSGEGDSMRAVTVAEVFIDAALATEDGGETGATLPSGVKVGPNTLAEILCGGKIRVITTDGLHPVAYSDRTDVIPPAVRRFVQWRDMGQCSIEGCHSRYRIQPHHIRERHRGGDHHPDNLVSLCWYHHHIAIHQLGYTIDPESPTHRRRLLSPRQPTGPPLRDQYPQLATTAA
jgi:Domain of unknown function (DUF222)